MANTSKYINESREEGRKLSNALSGGWRPTAVAVPIQLQPGENCYASGKAQIWQFAEGDGTYLHKTRFGFSALGLGMAAATVVGNNVRKARASREAQARFRPADEGPFFVTDRRFAIQGSTQWIDLWYQNVRMHDCNSICMTLNIADIAPVQIYAWPIDYFYVLFRFLLDGTIVQVPSNPV